MVDLNLEAFEELLKVSNLSLTPFIFYSKKNSRLKRNPLRSRRSVNVQGLVIEMTDTNIVEVVDIQNQITEAINLPLLMRMKSSVVSKRTS